MRLARLRTTPAAYLATLQVPLSAIGAVVVPVVVPVVPLVLAPVVVPVVAVVPVVLMPVVLVPVVSCPHAGSANTKTKARDTNIVRKYGTDFPCSFIYHTNPLTIAYRCKQCNDLGKRDVAASPTAATGIRTFDIAPPRGIR